MLARQVAAAIEAARPSQLDDIAQTLWKAHAAALLTAEDAQGLAEAIEARRALGKALNGAQKPERRRVGSRPRSAASLERRRRWVAAGLLPPQSACQFTMGEQSALAVVAIEVQKRGRCELAIGAIAATAGVGETTVRNALRQAQRLGLLTIEERRLTWTRNLPNVVRIVCPDWTTWLRLGRGGCKFAKGTPTKVSSTAFTPFKMQVRKTQKQFSKSPPQSGRAVWRNSPPKTGVSKP